MILIPLIAATACSQASNEDITALQETVEAMSAQNAQMAEAMATQTFMIQYLWEKIKAPQVKEEGEEEGRGSYLRSQTASVCCRARGPAVKLIF